jgi:8-oxo-dGTP pyrophosphatase MutT (NUDIX family)
MRATLTDAGTREFDIDWLRRHFAAAPVSIAAVYGDQGARPDASVLKAAAVLLPIVARPEELTVLFTRRTAHLRAHSGQISFPGGRVEPQDADDVAAALREAQEEIGLAPERIEILGELATYETVTGYRVTPVVGWVEPPFDLQPDPVEVAAVFEVPLAFLLDPANHLRHFRMLGELRRDYWAMPYGERYIWGATAAMLLILERTLKADA